MKIKSLRIPDNDYEFTVRSLHRPGSLGKLLTMLGTLNAVVGEISTVSIGETHSIRKITIAVYDEAHLKEVEEGIRMSETAELISRNDLVFERHRNGKIHSGRKEDVKTIADLRYIYTPGVARICKEIIADKTRANDLTSIGNSVGIFTNGTRVLGLGNIGPVASMPVMEGKAIIYDQCIGLSAVPVLVDAEDPDEFIEAVVKVAPTFGGIHLEDIRAPDCFYIEDELNRRLEQPVMHDDQHGTATVAAAAVISALRLTGIEFAKPLKVSQIGLGAAGFAIASLLLDWGAEVTGVDPNENAQQMLLKKGGKVAGLEDAMKTAQVVISTTGAVGLIKPEMIQQDQIILALSNPQPEIAPEDAKAAGAIFAADGTTINNALAFPGLFKGAMNAGAQAITSKMKLAAAEAISLAADKNELVPSPLDLSVHQKVAEAVEKVAR